MVFNVSMRAFIPILCAQAFLLRKQTPDPTASANAVAPSPLWAQLTDVLKPFTLVEGFSAQEPVELKAYAELAKLPFVKTICETGFNAGHSSLLWLLSNPNAKLYSFDLAQYPYTLAAEKFLLAQFPNRFELIKGNTIETLPKFVQRGVSCDLSIVDGGHGVDVATADLNNLGAVTSKVNRVVIDDTPCAVSWCYGPALAWQEGKNLGIVTELATTPMGTYRGFSVGQFNVQSPVPAIATVQMSDSVTLMTKVATQAGVNKVTVNFGAGDGVNAMPGINGGTAIGMQDPVYPLYQLGYVGLAVEGNPAMLPLLQQNLPAPVVKTIAMIAPDNVDGLMKAANIPKDLDYFKNDIDSYDCAVLWQVLRDGYRPKLMQVEVNPEIPYPLLFGIHYAKEYKPNLGAMGFYGCNLGLTAELVEPFGYKLVGVGPTHDAFFMREDIRKGTATPLVDIEAASAKLLECCNAQQFGIGAAAAWYVGSRELPREELQRQLHEAVDASCKISQSTPTCQIPFTLSYNSADFVAHLK